MDDCGGARLALGCSGRVTTPRSKDAILQCDFVLVTRLVVMASAPVVFADGTESNTILNSALDPMPISDLG